MTDYLPTGEKVSFAIASVDPTSGTLSIHFKPKDEVHRVLRVRSQGNERPRASDIALDFFRDGFDLRTIADEYSGDPNTCRRILDVVADVKHAIGALHCVNPYLAEQLLAKFPPEHVAKLGGSVSVSHPCQLQYIDDSFGYSCICTGVCQRPGTDAHAACLRCRAKAGQSEEVHVVEANDKERRHWAIKREGSDEILSICFGGVGDECNGKLKDLMMSYRFSGPLASIGPSGAISVWEAGREMTSVLANVASKQLAGSLGPSWSENKDEQRPDFPEPTSLKKIFEIGEERRFLANLVGDPKRLGGGQSGVVYRVVPDDDIPIGGKPHRDVVLKVLDKRVFLQESISPPVWHGFGMRPVLFGTHADSANGGILMPRLDGKDMEKCLSESPQKPTLVTILHWLIEACAIVKLWQNESWIHWDIKPANLFVCGDQVYLVDFGLACRLEDKDGRKISTRHVRLKIHENLRLFGSHYHIAPELRVGGDSVTTLETPMYGLGALVCNLLGDPNSLKEFDRSNPLKPNTKPEFPEWAKEVFGAELKILVTKALSEKPEDRGDVDKLKAALGECQKRVIAL